MKKFSIIITLVASLFTGLATTSCSDMLSPDSERHSYEVAGDSLYSYWGILRSMQNIAERTIILGECRGELIDGTAFVSDSIKAIMDYNMEQATDGSNRFLRISDYYHVINSCNAYLAAVDRDRVTGTDKPYMLKELAQVEAIRAWTYLQLIQIYGEVPFYTTPLLTTDDINNFIQNPNHQMANADNLADLLVPSLLTSLEVEREYGFPSYEKYGYTAEICHSTKAMIPLNIIIADLYLTKGDEASCTKAAQYYYDYLSNNLGTGHIAPGGALPNGYNYYSLKGDNDDKPRYSTIGSGTYWTETGQQNREKECITGIASSTNKLWGHVLRGIPELLGYDSEISVNTGGDSTASANIVFVPQYDKKQIAASPRYFNICDAQTFETYIGTTYELKVVPDVGDARQFWVKDVKQTYDNGVDGTEKFIVKNHPKPADFNKRATAQSLLIPIYRKSTIWLRYAEALNRAGYPSYAFAILKNGLCSNNNWFPEPNSSDYAVKDSAIQYFVEYKVFKGFSNKKPTYETVTVKDTFPKLESDDEFSAYGHKADVYADAIKEFKLQEQVDDILRQAEEKGYTITLSIEDLIVDKGSGYIVKGKSYENYPDITCAKALDYLDAREVLRAPTFLNYNDVKTLNGNFSDNFACPYRISLTSNNFMNRSAETNQGADNVTVGIHSRGCGLIRPDDMKFSSFDYVKLVQKIAEERYGVTLSKQDIYNGTDDETVKKCVEDLIVDEEALELAFEGTRFFDLMRVAHRRNDPKYLAERVSMRSGEMNMPLYEKLNNTKAWYFPLPQK